ncbi:MAG: 50S ribosomal protein L29 [Betaproteobacteria bacterium]|jgi:large subunit ribosomal protein L29|nr:MAG: 50S ribosomal protein L29 [Betaproteobacteria bacterium]
MKISEIRGKNAEEMNKELLDLMRAQFSLRMQLSTQQSTKTHELRRVRRDIARVRTLITEAGTPAAQ